MAEHPVVGERILRRTPSSPAIAPIVRHEHEHWDGTGYPDGLARPPDPDRLADHPRLRRLRRDDHRRARTAPALDREQAVAELRAGAGTQFDPEVVDALLDLLGQTRRGAGPRERRRRSPPTPLRGRR